MRSVSHKNRKRAFEVETARGTYQLPYSRVAPRPDAANPIAQVFVDVELARGGHVPPASVPQSTWPAG